MCTKKTEKLLQRFSVVKQRQRKTPFIKRHVEQSSSLNYQNQSQSIASSPYSINQLYFLLAVLRLQVMGQLRNNKLILMHTVI